MKVKKSELAVSYVHDHLNYDPETGVFTWITRRSGVKFGSEAGCINSSDGYRYIQILGVFCSAHRLAWLYMTGRWPKEEIDHIDCDRRNNRWNNLREASHSQNGHNHRGHKDRACALKGVNFHKGNKTWRSNIYFDGRHHHLGSFGCPAVAHFAYIVAADKAFGEFARAS